MDQVLPDKLRAADDHSECRPRHADWAATVECVAQSGITVNALAPGFTLTDASLGLIEDAASYGVNRGAIKRAAHAEDVVGAAIFLASPASDFITEQTLIVDGGRQFL